MLEQKHQQKGGQVFVDYEMFIHTPIEADEVLIVKVAQMTEGEAAKQSLAEAEEKDASA